MQRPERHSRLMADINIAPFTDVILVLLIIFMVTTPFIYRSSIKIALPQASSNGGDTQSRDIDILIIASGDVYLENQHYNLRFDSNIFRFKLQTLAKKQKNPAIIINADRTVKYDFVVRVMDIASRLGLKRLILATQVKR